MRRCEVCSAASCGALSTLRFCSVATLSYQCAASSTDGPCRCALSGGEAPRIALGGACAGVRVRVRVRVRIRVRVGVRVRVSVSVRVSVRVRVMVRVRVRVRVRVTVAAAWAPLCPR